MSSPSRRRVASLHRAIAAVAVACAALSTGGCHAGASLSARELLRDLDQIVRFEGEGPDRRIDYRTEAEVAAWYSTLFLTQPVRPMLELAFGDVGIDELGGRAPAIVRELVAELPDEVDDELGPAALASSRLAWVAHLDRNPFGRQTALDALVRIAIQLELPVFPERFDEFGIAATPTELAQAQAGVRANRPDVRNYEAWSPALQGAYADALMQLTARPAVTTTESIEQVEELTELYRIEPLDEVRPAAEQALRRSLTHLLAGLLMRTLRERSPETIELRLCAMEHVRRLAGPRGVALLLAQMAPPRTEARDEQRYDSDPLIPLRLIHYCGQLRGDLAVTSVRLPDREAWEAVAPAEFLATTILQEDQIYSKLRLPAVVALTWSLGRSRLDPDTTWVREWIESRRR